MRLNPPETALRHALPLVCLLAGLLAAGGSGCAVAESPEQAFDRWAAAAQAGDEQALLEAMTTESASVLSGLLAVSQRPSVLRLGDFPHEVRARKASLAGDGTLALVVVETSGDRPERGQVVMRLEDGHWRLDLIATELLWNREWELSGGPPRTPGWLQVEPMGSPHVPPVP